MTRSDRRNRSSDGGETETSGGISESVLPSLPALAAPHGHASVLFHVSASAGRRVQPQRETWNPVVPLWPMTSTSRPPDLHLRDGFASRLYSSSSGVLLTSQTERQGVCPSMCRLSVLAQDLVRVKRGGWVYYFSFLSVFFFPCYRAIHATLSVPGIHPVRFPRIREWESVGIGRSISPSSPTIVHPTHRLTLTTFDPPPRGRHSPPPSSHLPAALTR